MPVVFYILGAVFGIACAHFAAAAFSDAAVYLPTNIAAALGAGIIGAIFLSTGAITEALLSRRDAE